MIELRLEIALDFPVDQIRLVEVLIDGVMAPGSGGLLFPTVAAGKRLVTGDTFTLRFADSDGGKVAKVRARGLYRGAEVTDLEEASARLVALARVQATLRLGRAAPESAEPAPEPPLEPRPDAAVDATEIRPEPQVEPAQDGAGEMPPEALDAPMVIEVAPDLPMDPPPADVPADVPPDASACQPQGSCASGSLSCTYTCPSGTAVACNCVNGGWSCGACPCVPGPIGPQCQSGLTTCQSQQQSCPQPSPPLGPCICDMPGGPARCPMCPPQPPLCMPGTMQGAQCLAQGATCNLRCPNGTTTCTCSGTNWNCNPCPSPPTCGATICAQGKVCTGEGCMCDDPSPGSCGGGAGNYNCRCTGGSLWCVCCGQSQSCPIAGLQCLHRCPGGMPSVSCTCSASSGTLNCQPCQ